MSNFDFEQLKVLYVDPNERAHVVVRTILNAMGIKKYNSLFETAELFNELSRRPPDILITEYKLDDIDGLELIRRIRQDDKAPDHYLPIILLTGHTERRIVAGARDAGVHHVLAKPISIQQFYGAVSWLVTNPVPFIQSGEYYGPDRRRKERPFDGEERRSAASAAEQASKDAAEASQKAGDASKEASAEAPEETATGEQATTEPEVAAAD